MSVRVLHPGDALQFQSVRLRGLRECPTAFASSYEEEFDTPLTEIASRLKQKPDRAIFGYFAGADLLAVVGIQREAMKKLSHKAYIWGMYVAPEARRGGVGRGLLSHAVAFAGNDLGARQVNLGVNTQNTAALNLYESLGFRVCGTERGCLLVDGVLHDEHQMVRHLASEVPGDSQSIAIRSAVGADAERIAALGMQVFLDTYAIGGIGRIFANYVFKEFTPARIVELMSDSARHILVAEREEHLLGFAVTCIGRSNPMVASTKAAELERLYIVERVARHGLGSRMLDLAERRCSDQGMDTVWLTTWVGNTRALSFYARKGYVDVAGTHFEHAGARYENRLLAKKLG